MRPFSRLTGPNEVIAGSGFAKHRAGRPHLRRRQRRPRMRLSRRAVRRSTLRCSAPSLTLIVVDRDRRGPSGLVAGYYGGWLGRCHELEREHLPSPSPAWSFPRRHCCEHSVATVPVTAMFGILLSPWILPIDPHGSAERPQRAVHRCGARLRVVGCPDYRPTAPRSCVDHSSIQALLQRRRQPCRYRRVCSSSDWASRALRAGYRCSRTRRHQHLRGAVPCLPPGDYYRPYRRISRC